MCHVYSAHKTTTLVDVQHTLKGHSMTDSIVTNFILWPNCLRAQKWASSNQKWGALFDKKASITLNTKKQMQVINNKMHNKNVSGIKSQKTINAETTKTKISKTMCLNLIMKTKWNRRNRTTTNRLKTTTYKVNPTAALHRGWTGIKMIFIIIRWTRRTTVTESRIIFSAI